MLAGREAECQRLDALIEASAAGESAALVLVGEAGVGKTTLLDYAASRAETGTLLRARGSELESELAFSGLADLVRPIVDHVAEIPGPQSAALAGALALGPPTGGDRFTVCAATLSLFALAAEDRPVLVLIDDAQWLDAPSTEALVFAARRLGSEGVVLLAAVRSNEDTPFIRAGLETIAVETLADATVAAVIHDLAPGQVADAVVEQIVVAARGNPLALAEIMSALDPDQLAGAAELPGLAAGHELADLFRSRLESLPAPTRDALVVAAAGEAEERSTIVAALAALGLADADLAAAEAAGLVDDGADGVRFRHPVGRAASYAAGSADARRKAHRALASAVVGERSADHRAWHLATAASDPDEEIAAALELTAADARERGGYAAAASALERAANLTLDSAAKTTRLVAAADDLRLAGRSLEACSLLELAVQVAPTAAARADAEHLWGAIEVWRGAPMRAHELLVGAAERIERDDPARAATMLADAVLPCFIAGDSNAGLAMAERARVLGQRAGGTSEQVATAFLDAASILKGECADARSAVLRSQQLLAESDALSRTDQLVHFAGALLVWIEEYDWARELIDEVIEQARGASALGALPIALAGQSALEFRTGNWPAAYASAAESHKLAVETDQKSAAAHGLVCLGRVEAAQGREELCRDHVARARALAGGIEAGAVPMFLGSIIGLLELGLGRPELAIAELADVAALADELGVHEPGVIQWAPDYIEALIRADELTRAEKALDQFQARAEFTGRTWALAAALRCRGLLASESGFESLFASALEWHAKTPTPFERARTELCLGERLRRVRRRADAREPLRAALATFEALGAGIWAERARTELAASGEETEPRVAFLAELTPQELQVALIVGRGATNREAGAALFLSPKTIETHLGRVYRKLELRSRTELAHRLAAGHQRDDTARLLPARD